MIEVCDTLRKCAIFLIVVMVATLTSPLFEERLLDDETVVERTTSSSSLDMIIMADGGEPLTGAEVTVTDAWTDLTVAGPEVLQGSRLVFDNLPAGPVRIRITHPTYASSMAIANLSAYELIVSDVALYPLDATLDIASTPASEVKLMLPASQDEFVAICNSTGNATFAVPTNGQGWITTTNDNNKSMTRWNGQANQTVILNGTMRIFGWPEDANESGILRIEHSSSNFWELLEWSGEVDYYLPRIDEGEWRIYNVENGIRIGQPITSQDTGEGWNITSQLTNSTPSIAPEWSGHAYLNMSEAPEKGESFDLTWEASFTIPTDFGSALLPGRSQGLIEQIDGLFGNGNGALSGGELAGFSMLHEEMMWAESNHLFLFDESPMAGNVSRGSFSLSQYGNVGEGSYSWTESAILQGQAAYGSSRIFWFPVRGDAIEAIPITVNLPSGWEVRYSPQMSLMTSNQSSFTINRSLSPTVGMWTVTVGPNQAPIADGQMVDRPGLTIPLEGNTTLLSECSDSGMGDLTNAWELRHNGSYRDSETNDSYTFIPKEIAYYHGQVLNATLLCTDWDGARSNWWIDLYVDGVIPQATLNTTEEATEGIPPYFHDLNNNQQFSVRAGTILTVIANTYDDSGAVVKVTWRSNKSEGWEHQDFGFADQFVQGNGVNWMHMSVEDRHQQRELTVYSLTMELVDSAGNTNLSEWDITILDAVPPTITAEVMVGGYPIGPLNPAIVDSNVTLNLTRSFDDIDAIEKTGWAIVLDGQPILENGSWEDARIFNLPPLDVGTHEMKIYAMDSSGNVREIISNPVVEPQIAASVSGLELSVEGSPIIGEPGVIGVKIQNIGSTNAKVKVCYHEQCSKEWDSGEASANNPATVVLPIEIEEFENGKISVVVQWTDEISGEGGTFTLDSDITPSSKWADDADVIIGIIVFGYFGYLLFRQRQGKENSPF
ncbi:MAG: carboxypeptidase regulatory-like domain-containing protein [Euryarchaeota archaeon]|nr:carboxypeptidase regulatory-like domain-containing protein [Euryarchaeota archaeon]